MVTYCIKQRKKTKCVPGSEIHVVTKNGRNARKCTCAECGITKFTFKGGKPPLNPRYNKSNVQALTRRLRVGGALANRRGPSAVDKAAYIMSNFVTPAPSFAALCKVLAGQAFKGVKDNVDF